MSKTKTKKPVTQRFLLSVDIPVNKIPTDYVVTGEYRKLVPGEFGLDLYDFEVTFCSESADWDARRVVLAHCTD